MQQFSNAAVMHCTYRTCVSAVRSVTLLKHKVADQAAIFDKMDTFQKHDAKKNI